MFYMLLYLKIINIFLSLGVVKLMQNMDEQTSHWHRRIIYLCSFVAQHSIKV